MNTTSTNTSNASPTVSATLQVFVVILYSISIVTSLVGNMLILYIIHKLHKKPCTRRAISYLFVNLAVADLIITLIAMPDGIAHYFRNSTWLGGKAVEGNILCRVVRFSFVLAIGASICTLIAMTVNRFLAVVYPMRADEYYSPRKSTIIIWLSATVLTFHRLLTYSTIRKGDCKSDWSLFNTSEIIGSKFNFYFYSSMLFILPLIVMAALFSVMYINLQRRTELGIVNLELIQSQNRKVVKMLISIVVVFILCWIPAHSIHLLWMLEKKPHPYEMFLCFWCGHSHSAINPWMYIYLNTQFRRPFLKIIGKRSTGNKIKDNRVDWKTYNIKISKRTAASLSTCYETAL